jgi:RimJ/RimL family protein N-acetyltransferase
LDTGMAIGARVLRRVEPGDVAIFFVQQDDAEASAMAAFPSRDREAHDGHWARILADATVLARTVLDGDLVAGYVVGFLADGRREVGFWLGRPFWGRGLATAAVAEFRELVGERPLFAHVAEHNTGSLTVLRRNGFALVGQHRYAGDDVTELELRLGSPPT